MAKKIKAIQLTAVALGMVAAGAQAAFLQPGKIVAGSDVTFAPYEYMKNDKPVGFDIEMLSGIANAMGRQLVTQDTRFENLIPGLRGKKFDVTNSAMYITPARLKVVDMIPYLKTGQSIVVLASSTFKPKTAEDLCGHRTSVQAGTSFLQNLQHFSDDYCVKHNLKPIAISQFSTDPQATQALLSHAADAQITDVAVALSAVDKLKGRVVISSDKLLYPQLLGIGVRKDDPEVKQAITEGLHKFSQTPQYKALLAKYKFTAPTADDIKSLMPAAE